MSTVLQRKLTVVGAGFVGMTAAQLCAQKGLAAEIVLIDVLEGRPQGIALDLNQMAAIEGSRSRVVGTNDPADTRDSDLFIVTAGRPRKPGMSRSDLLEVNGRVMEAVAEYVRVGSPEAHVVVVTNPLDTMVFLMRAKLGFPARRVTGMAGCWTRPASRGSSPRPPGPRWSTWTPWSSAPTATPWCPCRTTAP